MMNDIGFSNAGYNVAELKSLKFHWSLRNHAFLYFQGPVLVSGKRYDAGACILYPEGTMHDYVTLDGFVNSYIGFYAPEDIFSKLSIKTGKVIFPDNCGEINDILRDICIENSEKRRGFEEAIVSLIIKLLVAISRGTEPENMKSRNVDIKNKLTALRARYLSNVLNPPDINDIITSSGLSRTHFYRLYTKLFGVSPKEDLIWARLDKAREILRSNPDMTIAGAALICGFADPPYFSRQFKQRYGYTPKNYASACKTESTL